MFMWLMKGDVCVKKVLQKMNSIKSLIELKPKYFNAKESLLCKISINLLCISTRSDNVVWTVPVVFLCKSIL